MGNARILFRQYPISMTFAVGSIIFGAFALVMVNYIYRVYIIGAFHNYPEEVAKKLRRAMYYSTTDVRPQEAVKYYKQAILVAEEVGMDPWSDEVIGIKLAVAGLMDQVEAYEKEILALEIIRRDCLSQAQAYEEKQDKRNKTRMSKWALSITVKLGELYSLPEIWDRETAEERMSWAVETMLKERQRRDNLKISDEDEGPWLSNDEIGATLEKLAHNYESRDQHYLAAPLFLHAINLKPSQNCHTVVLMNNLASSLVQQTPRAASATQAYAQSQVIQGQPSRPPVTREILIEMAQTWAKKALDVASTITPPERDEECDIGCAVALHNLGELAEMVKDFDEAKRHYSEAISLARKIGFQEGVENSSSRLRKLKQAG